jgi:hypothetical protein
MFSKGGGRLEKWAYLADKCRALRNNNKPGPFLTKTPRCLGFLVFHILCSPPAVHHFLHFSALHHTCSAPAVHTQATFLLLYTASSSSPPVHHIQLFPSCTPYPTLYLLYTTSNSFPAVYTTSNSLPAVRHVPKNTFLAMTTPLTIIACVGINPPLPPEWTKIHH